MTREYELVYLFDSALEEAQINERLDRFHALLKTPDRPEPVTATAHWGKRTLAYPIKGKEVGYYVVVRFETEPALLPEMERLLRLEEGLLRYLLVVNEGLAPPGAAADAGAAAEVGAAKVVERDDHSDGEDDE